MISSRSLTRWIVVAGVGAAMALALLVAPNKLQAASGAGQRIPVKVVVVGNFEPGADTGDAPGEFQFWAEREHLDQVIPIKGALHPLRRNKQGLYGMTWGRSGKLLEGTAEGLTALILDPRFDFTRTYWLFTGISGVDPNVASVGSAAWARWVIQGDAMRELDDREVPADWPEGLFAIGAERPNMLPNDPHSFSEQADASVLSCAYELNQGLARWAFVMSRNTPIPDTPALASARAAWTGFPNAQRPPFVLMGESLGVLRYWHGAARTRWAEDWVKLWTGGKGQFAMANMESQTLASTMYVLSRSGLVDLNRVMVLRTASNMTQPPPGTSPTASVGDEGPGQVVAFEANYRVGAPVVHELLTHWDQYRDRIPSTDASNP
jgi:purine nucleoside permease